MTVPKCDSRVVRAGPLSLKGPGFESSSSYFSKNDLFNIILTTLVTVLPTGHLVPELSFMAEYMYEKTSTSPDFIIYFFIWQICLIWQIIKLVTNFSALKKYKTEFS